MTSNGCMNTRYHYSFTVIAFLIALLTAGSGTGTDTDPGTEHIDYRAEMVEFVRGIRQTARQQNPDFLVIAQNGERLLTEDGSSDGAPNKRYLEAIDALSRESLFYGYHGMNTKTPGQVQEYIISYLEVASSHGKAVMAVSYCSTYSKITDSYELAYGHGYIPFAAPKRELTTIPNYPPDLFKANNDDITSLSEARNFLYILNPHRFQNKQNFLSALEQTDYDALVIDWVFSRGNPLTAAEVEQLKTKANGSRRLVFAYLSIGEAEDYRYYWQSEWERDNPGWLLPENPEWAGNYPVKYWEDEWKHIIYTADDSYLSQLVETGYDGVYLDRIDAFEYFQQLQN